MAQFVIGIVIAVIFVFFHKEMPINILLLSTQIFAVFVPSILYVKFKGVDILDTLRIKPLKMKYIIMAALLGISAQYVAQILNLPILLLISLLGELPPSPIDIPNNIPGLLVTLSIVAIAPAVFEEIMVRGIMMRAYEIRGTRAGIIISSLFFGLIHMDIKNLIGPIFFGIIFGLIVIRTGSIFAGIIAHFANNAFALIIGFLQENYADQFSFMNTLPYFFIVFFVSVIIFLYIMRTLFRKTDWEDKPPISTVKNDMKAAFINVPIMIMLVTYFIFQIFGIAAIINGS